ncbi:FMN-linked oxidoreductase [Schizophyllum commune H4-8]|uniref:NADH:flavin oxidoreductase/NADH oxidase N-terminal domain-containing protein n=1 Tax=Schizophyllum commune (strain H4-8 / FGSC 9210) TaxID=578458 RepID=D8QJL4_SCHCM|nr:FMN-linked oxidoreductase [Schizophyllum commune H4-8]KAI5886274.1 FMN-linked oxidoreductase [Schizophyllum commune H4-8]
MSSAIPKLFQPVKVGDVTLAHRIVLAPLTRFRATKFEHVPLPNVKEHYRQRGSTPGTLLITEATFIAPQAGGYTNVPGIWSDEQISKWKEVTDSVHAEGSFVYLQLWALGRAAVAAELKAEDPSFDYVAPSPIKLTGHDETPRALTMPEIKQYVQWYATAAHNAVKRAGFDGVEIHGANGYLIDQFLQDVSNHRTDEYGGSIENRSRFGLEVVEAVVKAVGASKTGIRLSPWGKFQDMRMADPLPQFSYFANELKTRHPDLSYLHLVEPRAQGFAILRDEDLEARESNDFLRKLWAPKPLITAGAYTRELAIKTAEEKGDIIAVGRYFISNPDLPLRWRHNLPLTEYNRDTFYLKGDASPTGYTDYPFAEKTAEQSKL